MELAFAASKAGASYAKAGSILLHSAYDPQKEAERFVDAALGPRRPSCFILSGPCLDYLSPALRARYPGALVLSIQHDARFRNQGPGAADDSWYPGGEESIESFLSRRIDEDALAGVQILEWPPASRAWPEEAAATAKAIRSVLDRLASSSATLKTFGRQWITNACRNFLLVGEALRPKPVDLPIVIASAGPSLCDALDILRDHRPSFALLAVSSALTTCLAKGLAPDLVVATDGGFWSRQHLYPLAASGRPLAMPLTNLPSASLAASIQAVFLDQGNFPEPELLAPGGGGLRLPSHGTVTGSAVQLAARLGHGPLILAGVDFANQGLLSHARPHGFDHLSRDGQTRLKPEESLLLARESATQAIPLGVKPWWSSRSLAIYAEALSAEVLLPPLAGRTFRLFPSPAALPGCRVLDAQGLAALFQGQHGPQGPRLHEAMAFERQDWPAAGRRRELLGSSILAWRGMAIDAVAAIRAGQLPTSLRARELLRAVDLPWWAAACRLLAAGDDAAGPAAELGRSAAAFLEGLGERLL
jgi:hypothetical protein